ncbi:restriction endonuclease subunit S [bacterium]|nr:restriction endonuclease subunit S [bacterium]
MREMKDSGVKWIGEIPVDWEVCRFKNVAQLFTGNSIKDTDKVNYEDASDARPYLATKDIDLIFATVNYDNGLYVKYNDFSFKVAPKGSTLMCVEGGSAGRKKTKLVQDVSFVNKLCCFQSKTVSGDYLHYFLCSPNYESEFANNLSGLIGGVSTSALKNIPFLLPPPEEQHRIADYLDDKCAKIDSIIEREEAVIEKLKNYKLSIITEKVTKGLNQDVPMKDSGVEWIGKIPEHWKVGKIKYVSTFNPPNIMKFDNSYQIGYVPMEYVKNGYILPQVIEYGKIPTGLSYFENGDIVIAKVTPCFENGNIAIASGLYNGVAFGSSELFVFRCKNIKTEFLFFIMQNEIFKKLCISTMTGTGGLKRISSTFIRNYKFAYPSIDEQNTIIAFLDSKCSKIDSIIDKKQTLITKLAEYKKSLIYEVVTGKKEV